MYILYIKNTFVNSKYHPLEVDGVEKLPKVCFNLNFVIKF